MATTEQVRRAMHRQPFWPFVIHLADGRTFPVRHPDFVAVTHRLELFFVADDDGLHELDMNLVAEIETPDEATQAGDDGA